MAHENKKHLTTGTISKTAEEADPATARGGELDREQMPTFEGLVLKRGKFFKSGFKLRLVIRSARSAIGQSVCSVLVATSALRMGAAQVDQARRGRASADLGLSRGQQEEARKVVHPLVSDSGACACAGQAPAHLPSWTFRRAPRPTPHVVIVLRCASNSYEECCALASGHLDRPCVLRCPPPSRERRASK